MDPKLLREEFSKLQGEANALLDTIAKETRDYTADEKAAQDARFERMEVINKQLEQAARLAQFAKDAGNIQLPSQPSGRAAVEDNGLEFSGGPITVKNLDRAEFGRALSKWAATGQMDRKFATITTATQSGALLPHTVLGPIAPTVMNTYREAMSLYGVAPIFTGNTADLTLPVMDPTAGGAVTETDSAENENPPSIAQSIRLTASTYESGSAWFSDLQLAAVDFDMLTAIMPELVYTKELGFESVITAALIADSGITQSVTTATATGFTYANLVSLNNALPKRYQFMKCILLSATVFAAAEGLVDENSRPVLVTDPQNQNLRRFNGTPVLRCDYFEALTADNVVGACFSLLGFKIRDCAGEKVARYVDQPGRPAQTGFNLFAFHGYGWADSAVAKFVTAAS